MKIHRLTLTYPCHLWNDPFQTLRRLRHQLERMQSCAKPQHDIMVTESRATELRVQLRRLWCRQVTCGR